MNPFDETMAAFRADPSTAQIAPAVTASLTKGTASLSGGPFTWSAPAR